MAEEQNKNTETETGTSTQTTNDGQGEFEKGFAKGFAKASEKATTKILDSLGVESVDDIKALMEEKQQLEDAKKTEQERLEEQLQQLKAEKEKMETEATKAQLKSEINSLAAKNGIKDVEYFEYQYLRNVGKEDFDADTFVEGLRESNSQMFGANPPKTDTSSNKNEQTDFKDKLKGLSFNELVKLQSQV